MDLGPTLDSSSLSKATNQWLLSLDKGCMNSVVFLDIKKAFDTVDHQILSNKLMFYGIHDEELTFFQSYLYDRAQHCQVKGISSSIKSIFCGVPQGSILGPLLFIIYMNDLPAAVPDISITMYAGDTEIGRSFTSVTEIKQHLMPAFCKVYEWLKCNNLSLNTVKTEFMVFGTNNRLNQLDKSPVTTPYTLCFYNFEIKRVKHTKYLGLIVDDTLTWEKHIEYISTKINHNIGILKRTQNFLPKSSLITLYKTLIEPYFRYCNIVWGQCNETLKDKLQSLQNKAVRTTAGQSYEYTNHDRLLKEIGWLSVRNLINLGMGVFMYKTQNGMAPEEFNQLFVPVGNIHGCLTRSAQNGNLQLPKIKLKCAQGSISYSDAKLWNSIPQ